MSTNQINTTTASSCEEIRDRLSRRFIVILTILPKASTTNYLPLSRFQGNKYISHWK